MYPKKDTKAPVESKKKPVDTSPMKTEGKKPNASQKSNPLDRGGKNDKETLNGKHKSSMSMINDEIDNENQVNQMGYSGYSNNNFFNINDSEGESIKVALRVRPMNNMELSRGDENCVKVLNDSNTQLQMK
jgi:hypothetical protein